MLQRGRQGWRQLHCLLQLELPVAWRSGCDISHTRHYSPQADAVEQPSDQQPAQSSQHQPIHVACVLERLPVLAPPPPAFEKEHHEWMLKRQISQGLRSDYPEVKHIYAPSAAGSKVVSKGGPAKATQAATNVEQEAVEYVTEADKSGDVRSMKRALTQRLFLLVKQPLQGSHAQWLFPHAQLVPGESVRQTCERALIRAIGRHYPAYFIGNAPMAHYPLLPKGGNLFFMSAQVVDDPWGPLPLPSDTPIKDHMWATRDEAVQLVGDARLADLLTRMLDT